MYCWTRTKRGHRRSKPKKEVCFWALSQFVWRLWQWNPIMLFDTPIRLCQSSYMLNRMNYRNVIYLVCPGNRHNARFWGLRKFGKWSCALPIPEVHRCILLMDCFNRSKVCNISSCKHDIWKVIPIYSCLILHWPLTLPFNRLPVDEAQSCTGCLPLTQAWQWKVLIEVAPWHHGTRALVLHSCITSNTRY